MTDDTSDTGTHRRTALKLAGGAGMALTGLTGSAAAHPGKKNSGRSQGKPQNGDAEEEQEEEDDQPRGRGRGRWCCSCGWGRDYGPGYERNFPHEEDDTEFDNWEPGDGEPPWADDSEDTDDSEEDEETDNSEDSEDSGNESPEEEPEETPDEGDGEQEETPDESEEEADDSEDTEETPEEGEDTDDTQDDQPEEGDSQGEDTPDESEGDGSDDTSEDTEDTTEDDAEDDEAADEDLSVSAQIEERVHAEVNAYRESQGLAPLGQSDELAEVARSHSEDMAENDYFSHDAPDGSGPGDRINEAGLECSGWGENIAWEQSSDVSDGDAESIADSAVSGWINSSGHRQNLEGDYDEEGIGVAVNDDEVHITQLFCSN